MDGVVRDLYHPLVQVVKREHPRIKIDPIEEWTDYHIWNHFKLKGQPVNEAWFKQLWFDRHVEEIYYKQSFTYPYAIEVLKHLKSKGHKIIFITASPNRKCMGWTMYFISKWQIPFNEIHFTDYDSKYKVDCDVYIEDSPYQAGKLADHYGFSSVWLYNQPWNKDIGWRDYCKKFDSWLDIEKEINRRFQ
jgi:hypothetical protein